jgi:alkylhydroperoxidase family enzyme
VPGQNGAPVLRISRLDRSQVDPDVAAIYDHFMKVRGNIPNMFRTAAHRPEIMKTMIAHFRAVMETGTVPAKLKELVIVRTSQINRCEY